MQLMEGVLIIGAESTSVQAMARVRADGSIKCGLPTTRSPDTCPLTRFDVDTTSSAGGWGYRMGSLGLFYAAGWTGTKVADPGGEITAPLLMGTLLMLGFFNTYSAPLQTGPLKVGSGFGMADSQMAYVVGASGEAFGISGRLGYYASDDGHGAS